MPKLAPLEPWREQTSADDSGPRRSGSEFQALYEEWFDEVARWVRALGGPPAEQEDLVQDVFVVVYRRLPDFDGNNVAGWLYRIAQHRVRDYRRLRWVRHVLFGGVPLTDDVSKHVSGPFDKLELKEKQALLERLLERLNESERAALVLFEIEGKSGEEIAAIQGIPLNTVWARIHKARKKLKAQLTKFEARDAWRAR